MKTSGGPGREQCSGQISGRVLVAIAIGAVVLIAAIYLLLPEPEPLPVPAPVPSTPLETVAPAESGAERGDSGREVIAQLRSSPGAVDYGKAYVLAQEFRSDGRLADAQLLYFFAARGGNGPAAFELATMYDPNHFSKDTSLMDRPDPFQAYKWYRDAQEAGIETAVDRLAELQAWAEEAAAANDPEAERLLLQWE
jgi:TPR repeat protein